MPYSRVTAHQPFVVKLICPPGGCVNNQNARMRLLTYNKDDSDRMGWDPEQLCKQWKTEYSVRELRFSETVPMSMYLHYYAERYGGHPDIPKFQKYWANYTSQLLDAPRDEPKWN